MTERLQRVSDCRRMMAEIVNHFHAPRFPTDFLPPRDTGKSLKRTIDFRLRHIIKSRCDRRHRRIAHVEFANERNFESFLPKLESRASSRVTDVADSLGAILRETHLNHLGKAILCHFHAVGIVSIQHYHPVLRNDIEQTPEGELDFIEVVEDVRMIELDVVHNQKFRQVMNKLRAFVEKS